MLTKEEILEAIRKTTQENGGKPLGKAAFCNITGIKPYEISKYWIYSDLIKEAGFEPNNPWTRYPDDLLVKKAIKKIRKYKRYPTLSELFIEFNKGDDFPFHIFKKRSQPYMVKKIMEYCKNKTGYEDVIEACKPILEELEKREKLNDTSNSDASNIVVGYVYLGKRGYRYKVGVTNNLPQRKTRLDILQPENFEFIHVIKTDDPYGIETYWKNRFKSKLIKGTTEWFKLNSYDIKAFDRWIEKIF